jgi:hypothetical protein
VASHVSWQIRRERNRKIRVPVLQETISMQIIPNNEYNFTIKESLIEGGLKTKWNVPFKSEKKELG